MTTKIMSVQKLNKLDLIWGLIKHSRIEETKQFALY